METNDSIQSRSRRRFLRNATAFSLAPSLFGAVPQLSAGPTGRKIFAYIGSYTSTVNGGGNGEGIYLSAMNLGTGELTQPQLVAKIPNPSWICVHPSKNYLYAINEITDANGSVSTFGIDPASGSLSPLNKVSSEGAGPVYMSLDASGKFAFVANYMGGSIAVLPILDDGQLGAAVEVHHDIGDVGAKRATDAPLGNFAISGHEMPHAHMIASTPDNRFVISTDLAQDRIYIYRFNSVTGKLTPHETQPFISLPSGDGPRHFVFHPNGHWFYSVQEEASTVAFFKYDPRYGSLTYGATISALPLRFAGTTFASEILVSSDGRFLYISNRFHDTISICSIGANGIPSLIGEASTGGDYPRNCSIDPSGNFLYACNQHSDCITAFKIRRESGELEFSGRYVPVGSPAVIAFRS